MPDAEGLNEWRNDLSHLRRKNNNPYYYDLTDRGRGGARLHMLP
jgi:hypothetical protein